MRTLICGFPFDVVADVQAKRDCLVLTLDLMHGDADGHSTEEHEFPIFENDLRYALKVYYLAKYLMDNPGNIDYDFEGGTDTEVQLWSDLLIDFYGDKIEKLGFFADYSRVGTSFSKAVKELRQQSPNEPWMVEAGLWIGQDLFSDYIGYDKSCVEGEVYYLPNVEAVKLVHYDANGIGIEVNPAL